MVEVEGAINDVERRARVQMMFAAPPPDGAMGGGMGSRLSPSSAGSAAGSAYGYGAAGDFRALGSRQDSRGSALMSRQGGSRHGGSSRHGVSSAGLGGGGFGNAIPGALFWGEEGANWAELGAVGSEEERK